MVYKSIFVIVGILTFLHLSCGIYSLGGSIPSDVQKVAIPLFDDNTSYPGVRDDLTNQVIDAFIADNTLQVVSESDADLLITGTIMSINERAAIVTTGETVQQYDVYVMVKVKCLHLKSGKVWWEKVLRRFGTMEENASQDERDEAIATALVDITRDVLDNTLANW
jgi:hypothetical protein